MTALWIEYLSRGTCYGVWTLTGARIWILPLRQWTEYVWTRTLASVVIEYLTRRTVSSVWRTNTFTSLFTEYLWTIARERTRTRTLTVLFVDSLRGGAASGRTLTVADCFVIQLRGRARFPVTTLTPTLIIVKNLRWVAISLPRTDAPTFLVTVHLTIGAITVTIRTATLAGPFIKSERREAAYIRRAPASACLFIEYAWRVTLCFG